MIIPWPVDAPWVVTQEFGDNTRLYGPKGHPGYDLAPLPGQPRNVRVRTAAGRVYRAGQYRSGVYLGPTWVEPDTIYPDGSYGDIYLNRGLQVGVDDPGGRYYVYYGHLSEVIVAEQQYVSAGQTVGKTGHTGWVIPKGEEGEHIHIGLWDEEVRAFIDPDPFMEKYEAPQPHNIELIELRGELAIRDRRIAQMESIIEKAMADLARYRNP